MKKVTKKQLASLNKAKAKRLESLTIARDLCVELLKKNNNCIQLPTSCIIDDDTFDVYGEGRNSLWFAGAKMVFDMLCIFGYNDDTGKTELIHPGYYNEYDLLWIAEYLTDYLNKPETSK